MFYFLLENYFTNLNLIFKPLFFSPTRIKVYLPPDPQLVQNKNYIKATTPVPVPEQDGHVGHELVVDGHEVPDDGGRVHQPLAGQGALLALNMHLVQQQSLEGSDTG